MNRRIIAVVSLVVLLSACENKKKQIELAIMEADSVGSIHFVEDTTAFTVEPIEQPLPVTGDESFEDFIYAFANDTTFQRSRVVFPLPYYEEDTPQKIEREDWIHDYLFIKQNYYALLLGSEDEPDHNSDDSHTSVQIELIFMKTRMVRKYYFERVDGHWMLEAINQRPVLKNKRENFIDFFIRFAADSLYQARHIKEPLEFVTTDPDDDFSVIETTLDIGQWFAFKPILPEDWLANIVYGQEQQDDSPKVILELKGVGNGFLNILFFRYKSNGKWELYKFEDTSN